MWPLAAICIYVEMSGALLLLLIMQQIEQRVPYMQSNLGISNGVPFNSETNGTSIQLRGFTHSHFL